MKKRILSFLMALAMVLSLLPSAAFAAETASGTCGENLTWSLSDGTLTISGTGEMEDYEDNLRVDWSCITTAPWGSYADTITSLVIKSGVTSIGRYAFCGLSSLESVSIPSSMTAVQYEAFAECESLEQVYISDLETWCKTRFGDIEDSGADGWNNPLSNGASLFLNGEKVVDLVIPEGVTAIYGTVFEGCSSIESVTIPSSVTSIGLGAFGGCDNLMEVHIGDLKSWCEIRFGDGFDDGYWNANPLVNGGDLFLNGVKLEEIVIPEGTTYIRDAAFQKYRDLRSVTIPSSVLSIGDAAFDSCEIEEVHISDLAAWCGIEFGNLSNPLQEGASLFLDGEKIVDLIVPAGVTAIADRAFECYSELKSVKFPAGITSIGDGAFSGCSGLQSVDIPKGVSSIGDNAFSSCSELRSVNIPDSVTSIKEYAFAFTALENVTIPEGVETIEDGVFMECISLKSASIPESVISIDDDAFFLCTSLENINIPKNVKYIGSAFMGCESIKDLVIPGSVESIDWAFYGCTALESIRFLGDAPSIAEYAFNGVTATAYYPTGNDTWTEDVMQDYGGDLTWQPVAPKLAAPAPKIYNKSATGQPYLYWEKVEGAAKYEIWRATSSGGTYSRMYTTTSTSYNNTSAVAGKTYYYKVRAIDANGNAGEFSIVKSITCDLAQPVNTKISIKAENGKPYLTWDAVKGATGYEIWRATSSSGTYTKMYTTSQTYYTNTSAKPSTTYYYRIKAVMSGNSYATSAYSATRSITCDCAAPSINITVKADNGKPYLTWKAVDGATKYEIYRATSKDGTYTKMYTTSQTYYTNTSAKPGTTYYYKIKALGTSSYATSAYSNIRSITCDCARPVVTITTNSAGKPYLDWDAVEGATKYEIWRATSKDGTYTKMYTTSSSYYTNTSAKSGTTYYYKVRALGSTSYANSAYSNIVSVKCK